MNVQLQDQVALVTGAAGAIGQAICASLAANGAKLDIADEVPIRVEPPVGDGGEPLRIEHVGHAGWICGAAAGAADGDAALGEDVSLACGQGDDAGGKKVNPLVDPGRNRQHFDCREEHQQQKPGQGTV